MEIKLSNINYDKRQCKFIIKVESIHYSKGYKFFL